jgi:hypothetical protein
LVEKVRDVVGPYMSPPENAIVLSRLLAEADRSPVDATGT